MSSRKNNNPYKDGGYERALFELSPVGFALCRMDGTIVDANPAFASLVGRTVQETVTLSWSELVAENAAERRTHLHSLQTTGRCGPYQAELLHRDGRRIPVRVSELIIDREGQPLIWGTVEDITELALLNRNLEARVQERTRELQDIKLALMNLVDDLNINSAELAEANEKLKEIDRLKSMFIASMSHEFRTPLNSVIGYSSVILNEWFGPVEARQKEKLGIVLRAGKHLLSLINDVIDVSKIEAGQIDVHVEEFDLFDLVSEAVQQLEPEVAAKGLALSVENVHAAIRTDRRRLLQALLNIFGNALKYTPEGSIRISAVMEGSWGEISVADTGIGIPPEEEKKIFKPFVRVESPLKNAVPGTGLGLYLTRKLVADILKGSVYFTSREGGGSVFTIRFASDVGSG